MGIREIVGSRKFLPDCTALGSQSTQRSVVWVAAPPTGNWTGGWGHQNQTCLWMLSNHWWYCCEMYSSETTGNLILTSSCSALVNHATNLSSLKMYYQWYLLLDTNEINTLLWESLQIFHEIYISLSPFLYPFICWWSLRLLPYLTIINSAAMSNRVHVSFWVRFFIFFGYLPRSKSAGSYGNSVFSF